MAFCNACGSQLDPNAVVCPKCGGTVPVTTKVPVAQTPAPSAAPLAQNNHALKTVLIVLAVVVALGVGGTVIATIFGLNVARHTRVEEHDGKVKVQTPFGTVETSRDPQDAARNMGVPPYPGATVHDGNSNSVNVGGTRTLSAEFETDDPPDKVADFYKSQLPHANVSVADGNHYSIVSSENKNLLSINIQREDGKTVIQIASVSGKAPGGSDSSD